MCTINSNKLVNFLPGMNIFKKRFNVKLIFIISIIFLQMLDKSYTQYFQHKYVSWRIFSLLSDRCNVNQLLANYKIIKAWKKGLANNRVWDWIATKNRMCEVKPCAKWKRTGMPQHCVEHHALSINRQGSENQRSGE